MGNALSFSPMVHEYYTRVLFGGLLGGGVGKGFWRSSSDSTLGNVTATGAIAGVGGTGGKNNNLCRNIFSSSKL